MRRGAFLGDLAAGVRGADDQHPPRREVTGALVVRAVELDNIRVEILRDRRNDGNVERSGRDHDLPGVQRLGTRLREVAPVAAGQRGHAHAEADRQLELLRIPVEVVGDVVLARVGIRRGGEWQARQVGVLRGREQPQRIPARAPRMPYPVAGVHDLEAQPGGREVIAEGHAGLPATDHQHVQRPTSRRGNHRTVVAGTSAMTILPRACPSSRWRIAATVSSSG